MNTDMRNGSFDMVEKPRSAMAVTGLVLGIIGLLTSLLPIINNISAILAFLGFIFAIVGFVSCIRGTRVGKGLAIAAIVVNVLAMVLTLGSQALYSQAIDEALDSSVSHEEFTNEASASDGVREEQTAYTVSDEALDSSNPFGLYITGTLTNNTDSDKSYIQVNYNLYDAEGAQIGTALANTNNLKAGSSWKFEAFGTAAPDEVASFELADVTGF